MLRLLRSKHKIEIVIADLFYKRLCPTLFSVVKAMVNKGTLKVLEFINKLLWDSVEY